MSHEAKAHRGSYGDPSLWTARCPDGCPPIPARSRQDAETKAVLHQAERLAASITCGCWYPEIGEYDPDTYPCSVDRLRELLKAAVAA